MDELKKQANASAFEEVGDCRQHGSGAADACAEPSKKLSESERRMDSEPMRSLVIKYSIPTIIGMLVNSLYGIVDRFWVGQIPEVGSASLAGVGLSLPITNIIMALSMLVGIGAAANISLQLGRQDRAGAQATAANGLTLIVILSLAFAALGTAFSRQLLSLAGATPDLMPYALPYSRVVIAGSIFNMTSFAMNHPIRAAGDPRRFAMTQMAGGFANMILDPIFIFIFHMGAVGAAVATIISQAAAACLIFSYYFKSDSPLKLSLSNMILRRKTVAAIFSIGASPFFMQLGNSLTVVVANHSLAKYGLRDLGREGDVIAIGAMTIISSVNMLFCMPVFGVNQGSQPIIGFNYGRRSASRVKDAFKWAVICACAITTAGFIAVEAGAEILVKAFNRDPSLVKTGSQGMRIFLCTLPILGFQIPSTNFFQAIGRAKISMLLSALRQLLLLIPAYIILPPILGFKGVWMAGPTSDLIATAVSAFFIAREFKRIDGRLESG
ncbi:MAG: MATE family efflux transporter [Clostridiales bacterium]|jgi:putative MATE family efflux protein|nr:MATE family efflux transporter [Clostridiales bacterium]